MKMSTADAQAWVRKNLTDWPQRAQKTATQLLSKYGPPNEQTAGQLIWHGNAPWKRTILFKEEVQHNFPMPHKDILQQFINYRVPDDKIRDIAQFNGSVVVDVTRGEVSAHCESEEMNFVALNLVKDIVTGNRSVDQAIAYNAQAMRAMMTGDTDAYLRGLVFEVPASRETANAGEVAPLMRHMSGELE